MSQDGITSSEEARQLLVSLDREVRRLRTRVAELEQLSGAIKTRNGVMIGPATNHVWWRSKRGPVRSGCVTKVWFEGDSPQLEIACDEGLTYYARALECFSTREALEEAEGK